MLSGEATNTNFIVFGLIKAGTLVNAGPVVAMFAKKDLCFYLNMRLAIWRKRTISYDLHVCFNFVLTS
jgi:hypothetical protein